MQPSQTERRGEFGHLCLHVWRGQLSLQHSHEEMQFSEGTTVAAAEPGFVLDNVADVFQLLVAQPAFMEPLLSGDVHSNRRWCSKYVGDQWQESLKDEFQGGAARLHITFIFTLEKFFYLRQNYGA